MSVYKGKTIRLEIEGASHAPSVGVKIQGIPQGFRIDIDELRAFLKRRAPGQNEYSTSRKEADEPIFLEGIDEDGRVDGSLIHAIIENKDVKSSSYDKLKDIPRPGHADYSAYIKYGKDYDYRGGGQFSGRMTAPLCIAGGIAKQIIASSGIIVDARAVKIGGSCGTDSEMKEEIFSAKSHGDSVGGIIECTVTGMPAGVGGPLFEGLESELSRMIYSIPAVKGVSFGAGFRAADMLGSENNDPFGIRDENVITLTNNAGGILGGISNGMPIVINVAVKPTPSIAVSQRSVNLKTKEEVEISVEGRHDPCIVPRAIPCVEAAVSLVILDMILAEKRELDLAECRCRIDNIDRDILRLYEERLNIVESVYRYKKANELPILDQKREDEKLDKASKWVSSENRDGAQEIMKLLMRLSRDYQEFLNEEKK